MRTAVLHTGETMQFPDDTPDHMIHKAVRAKMGLPPPPPTNEEIVNTSIAAMHALLRQMGVVADMIRQASQNVAQAAESVSGVDAGVQNLLSSVESLARTIQAPKRAVRNKDGSWQTELVGN